MNGMNKQQREAINGYADSIGVPTMKEDSEEEVDNKITVTVEDDQIIFEEICQIQNAVIGARLCTHDCIHCTDSFVEAYEDDCWIECSKKKEALGE